RDALLVLSAGPPPPHLSPLSLHDALPIFAERLRHPEQLFAALLADPTGHAARLQQRQQGAQIAVQRQTQGHYQPHRMASLRSTSTQQNLSGSSTASSSSR